MDAPHRAQDAQPMTQERRAHLLQMIGTCTLKELDGFVWALRQQGEDDPEVMAAVQKKVSGK